MITSVSNGKIRQVAQWQAKAKERREAGVFLAEGFKLFQEAPLSWIREVYLSEEAKERARGEKALWDKLNAAGYETVSPQVFQKISDTKTPQGVLCVVERPVYALEQMLEREAPLFAVLESIQDPGNLGTILRTGEGAGVTGIILGGDTVDPFSPKVIRATMGSIFRVPFVPVEDLQAALGQLKANKVTVYGAHLSGQEEYDQASYRQGTAFLIGNEGRGLSRETAGQADKLIRIPMEGQVESLNAAVSAALLLYEAHRQRK